MPRLRLRRSRPAGRRHVFRLHWRWWILPPFVIAVLHVGFLGLAGDWQDGRLLAWGLFVILMAVAAWAVWSQRIRIVVTDEGIRESTARSDRVFAWEEIRRIDHERDPDAPAVVPSRLDSWLVRCAGGRRLRFSNASIGGAHRLADVIRAGIRSQRRREAVHADAGMRE